MSKSKATKAAKTVLETATMLVNNRSLQKTLFGVYSDGTTRSFADCLSGEFLSPKDREKVVYGKKKKKGKKSKKKKPKIKL